MGRWKFFLIVCCFTFKIYAQEEKQYFSFPMVGTGFGVLQPMGFLGQRYGTFMLAGFDFHWLIRSRFLPGLDFKYGFTSRVKENVLQNVMTEDGFVINNEGNPADIRINGRIWYLTPEFMFLMPWGAMNPHSGFITGAGLGYVEHRVKFLDYAQIVAALDHGMHKGYDRFSGGVIVRENVGYLFTGNNRLTNFKIILSFIQMLTRNYRGINYDTGQTDQNIKFNGCFQGTVVWILPLYKKTAEGIYYTD